MPDTYPDDLYKLTVQQLKNALDKEDVEYGKAKVKDDYVDLLAKKIRPTAGKKAAGSSKGDSTKKAAAAVGTKSDSTEKADDTGNAEKTGATGTKADSSTEKAGATGNAEKTDDAGNAEKTGATGTKADSSTEKAGATGNAKMTDDAGNAEKANAAELNGGKTEGTSKKGSVRNLSDNNAPATSGTGGDILDDAYQKALAKFKQMQIGSEPEDITQKELDEAKKKFVELLAKQDPNGDLKNIQEDLIKIQKAIEKLQSLLKPKKYDQEGYIIYSSSSDPGILQKRVIWKDPGMKRAMITCGPKKAAIWRVVTLAEARAYDGFAAAGDWADNRVKSEDTLAEKKTEPHEARQIIGIGFARPIVVGLSMDRVFEKRSPKSRESKLKSLPANSAEDIKSIVASKHRRHVHIIMSYEREGVRFQKHLPFTHWLKVAGFQDPEKDPAGLDLVKEAAEYEQSEWEAWLEQKHPDSYKKLEEAGLDFESEDEKILQDSRDNTPEFFVGGGPENLMSRSEIDAARTAFNATRAKKFGNVLKNSHDNTPEHKEGSPGTKVKKFYSVPQDSRDNTPDNRDNSRESTPGISTPGTRGSTPDDTHDDAKTNSSDTKTDNSDKGTDSADVAKPTTETSDP